MKNTLLDLNNYLFEALERVNDDSLNDKELEKEIKKATVTVGIGNTIIHNADLILKAKKTKLEYGISEELIQVGDSHGVSKEVH